MEHAPPGVAPSDTSVARSAAPEASAPEALVERTPSRGAGRLTRGTLAVGAVLALAGMLFATNAALFSNREAREPQDLGELVAVEDARLEEATAVVDDLHAEVESLVDAAAEQTDVPQVPDDVGIAAGRIAVSGPGVVVRLWDAPTANAPPGTRPDDLLVHQQDLEAVMNAIWAGGAEAMTIQGQRVTATTRVRCVGNVLLLHGRTYSPPYEVAGIGDPGRLRRTLLASTGVRIYLQYVAAVGLGWSLTDEARLEMPEAEGTGALRYAQVPDDTSLVSAEPGMGDV